jgi:hypothetical protein
MIMRFLCTWQGRSPRDLAHRAGGTIAALDLFMLDSETAKELIHPHMEVVGSDGEELATVDHVEGFQAIVLAKDDTGQHHYIPLDWVQSVDDRVHLDRPCAAATRDWTTTLPRE